MHWGSKKQARNQSEEGKSPCYLFHAGFLLVLFFGPQDEGDIFLQNADWLSMVYTALYPTIQNSLEKWSLFQIKVIWYSLKINTSPETFRSEQIPCLFILIIYSLFHDAVSTRPYSVEWLGNSE
jgi:hypothetical protein